MLAWTSVGCALVGYDELIKADVGHGTGGSTNTGGHGDASITNSGGSTASGGVIIVGATGGNMGGTMAIRDASIVNTGGTITASGGDAATGGTIIIDIVDSGTTDSGVSTNVDSGMADASIPDASTTIDSGIPPDPNYGSLVHRYSFSPSNEGPSVIEDLVGDADGQLQGGASFSSSGTLTLDGSSGYVDLPDGLVSSLNSATDRKSVV